MVNVIGLAKIDVLMEAVGKKLLDSRIVDRVLISAGEIQPLSS